MKPRQRVSRTAGLAIAALVFSSHFGFAQGPALPLPQPSPEASVTQTVGITKIAVNYHRPGVKNRKVWGGLVPFNTVWRAGANENTTISFSDSVKIEGKSLAPGVYGLHMIPNADEWTIIFNKNSTSWGSFFYNENEDVLRVKVKPVVAEQQEWLGYEFADLTDRSCIVALRWEKLKVPFKVEIDVPATVLSYIRNEHLRGLSGFFWQGFNDAAAYCMRSNVNLNEALTWADRSININRNFTNLLTKSRLLDKLGRGDEAKALHEQAMLMASETDINQLGYQYLNENKMKEAIETFKKNVKDYPKSWNVYDSLAEAYEKNGDKKLAIEYYSQALKLVLDETNKKRITQTIDKLKGM
ncbi:MAG: DUF2911 domain-containing protein [Ignavibacteriae bacterium]|nr:DUF2911 domain-containing protein [Ignavibacteriota bacterium]